MFVFQDCPLLIERHCSILPIKEILVNSKQLEKTLFPMSKTELGIVILFILLQPLNA